MSNSTKKIYKKKKIDNYLFSSLINNELYFANPRDFNDIFDSRPLFQITDDTEKVKLLFNHIKLHISNRKEIDTNSSEFKNNVQKWSDLIQVYFYVLKDFSLYETQSLSIKERLAEIHTFYNYSNAFDEFTNLNPNTLLIKLFNDLYFLLVDSKKYGITCGSKTNTCPVMWGHYALNHTGLCFEFEIQNNDFDNMLPYDSGNIFEIEEVKYNDIPIDLFDSEDFDENELRRELLSTKSSKWSYEQEVRLISNQGTLKYKKSKLKSVIFGAKSTPKDRYTVCKLMASLGYKFEFKIARIQPDDYELRIDKMNLNDIANSGVHLEELNLQDQYKDIMK